MAVHGDLINPIPELTVLELLPALPIGDLIDPIIVTVVSLVESGQITNRFPTPPLAGGFLIDPVLEADPDWILPAPGVTRSITSILSPSLDVLEPQLGQIWPR